MMLEHSEILTIIIQALLMASLWTGIVWGVRD